MRSPELLQKKKMLFGEKATDFFFLFHTLSRGYHCCITKIAQETGLYKGQAPTLLLLKRKNNQTQRELCGAMGIKAASMTDMLQRMEKSGLIIRKRGEDDLRTMKVTITPKGRKKAEQFLQRELALDDIFFRGFTDEEKETFLSGFERITENLIHEIGSWEEAARKPKRGSAEKARSASKLQEGEFL